MRKGVDALRKRVDKHFGDADDQGISRNLVAKVLRECEAVYLEVLGRTEKIGREVYEGAEGLEWGREEVAAAFRR